MALKLGTEDKKKAMVAAALGLVVLYLLIKTLLGTFGGSGTPAPAVTPPSGEHAAVRVSAGASMSKLDPTLHPEIMAAAESLKYTGKGRNIFSMYSTPAAIEQVKAPVRPGAAAQIQAGPPQPPPIDLKFFGYESAANGQRKAFLLHGDDVFIAVPGDVVDHRYKVLSIQPFSIQVEDLPYKNTQSLPLIQN